MCGIFCAFGLRGHELNHLEAHKLKDAARIMNSRGPDYFGHYRSTSGDALIFHSRLAIRGLDSRFNQPYICPDGSILAYNGEVYSIGGKRDWGDGESDTPAFAKHIVSPNKKMNEVDGMYAYVRYSAKAQRIWLGRDLFGEKPLYMLKHDRILFVFSEVSYLQIVESVCGFKPETSRCFMARFMAFGYRQSITNGGLEVWDGVSQVKPATEITIDLTNGRISSEATDSIYRMYVNRSVTQEIDFEGVIRQVVARRAASDVPTGISLSGGIDSNVVASILRCSGSPPTHAFTVCSNDPRYSEFDLARKAASAIGLIHIGVALEDEGECQIERFIRLSKKRQSPFLTMSSFVSTYIAREAQRNGIKVMFSGIGGDELFSGYYDYFFYRMLSSDYSLGERASFEEHVLPFIKNPIMKHGYSAASSVAQLKHHYPNLAKRIGLFNETAHIPALVEPSVANGNKLRSRMFADITHDVIPIILHEDDINFMSYSVENRSPLLSKEILLLSLSMNDNELMANGYQKALLRDLLKRLCPDIPEIYENRRKQGYNYSILDLMRSNPPLFQEVIYAETGLWELINKRSMESEFRDEECIDETLLFAVFSLQAFLLGSTARGQGE